MVRTVWRPYNTTYWNGGQRSEADLILAWTSLLEDSVALHVSEVADQIDTLRRLERRGYGLILGPDRVPDGRKEAILYDKDRLTPIGETHLDKVGDAFEGRRHGRPGKVRMANKYVLHQEFTDELTGWTPVHAVTHVWPSVTANKPQVRALCENIAEWQSNIKGTLILPMDANMEADHELISALSSTELLNSQLEFGPVGTWGPRAIDMFWARPSKHFRITGQEIIRIPGRERGGASGHKAVKLIGEMKVKQ